MDKPITLLIADDHAVVREGLVRLLSSQEGLVIASEAGNGKEAVLKAVEMRPDIVLMDLGMPVVNGIEATRQIKQEAPWVRILVLTAHEDKHFVDLALKAGADGYLLKNSDKYRLTRAIHAVMNDGVYMAPEMLRDNEVNVDSPSTEAIDKLTRREREVFNLVARGMKNREISDELCISVKTVEKHRANLMKKLGLHSVAELVSCALRTSFIQPSE
jgi:RNA polymerase sigma factor (sigma-70 family)